MFAVVDGLVEQLGDVVAVQAVDDAASMAESADQAEFGKAAFDSVG